MSNVFCVNSLQKTLTFNVCYNTLHELGQNKLNKSITLLVYISYVPLATLNEIALEKYAAPYTKQKADDRRKRSDCWVQLLEINLSGSILHFVALPLGSRPRTTKCFQ